MNIYFSCSLTGGRNDQPVYAAIVDYLLANGHEVPTAHLAQSDVMDAERVVDPVEVFTRDVEWVQACDALIADVSTPSHGVGYEIALALSLEKPVLCCYRKGALVSKMISGNTGKTLALASYQDNESAVEAVRNFLESIKQQQPAG